MKRLTLFATALMVAVSSFAAVSYELNGGVTNPKGWTTPQDMFTTLTGEIDAFNGTTKTWTLVSDYNATAPTSGPTASGATISGGTYGTTLASADGFPNFKQDSAFVADFQWLVTYLDAVATEAGKTLPTSDAACFRAALDCFFANGQMTNYLGTGDFTNIGVATYSAYAPTWKAAYANPTEPTDSFKLNVPYKEGETFDGWYANADFSGEKVTHVSSATTGTLYAKWLSEVIPTVAEVLALADNTETKLTATVTLTVGSTFWVQDATGAIMCYGKNNGLVAGEVVVLKGIKQPYNGVAQLGNVEVLNHEAGTAIAPSITTISALDAAWETNISKLVRLEGVVISYDGTKVFLGSEKIEVYGLANDKAWDATKYPANSKVNATVIVGAYNGAKQFRTTAANIEAVAGAEAETYQYPARGENSEYTLKNKWLFSNVMDNFASNKPNGATGEVRGMALKNGKLYFIDRANKQFVVVDAATGVMEAPVKLADNVFTYTQYAGTDSAVVVATPGTLNYNDVKKDAAGNLLVGQCITNSQIFQIWKVDEKTGAGTLVVEEALWANPANDSIKYRFDAFGVYGDVDAHAIIMAADANSMTVFKWTINEGKVDGLAEMIELYVDPEADNSYLITKGAMITNPGTAPQVFPVDDDYFYLDGNATFPTLFNMDGTLADDLMNCTAGIKVANNEGDTCTLNQGHNGLLEFQVGNEYFVLFAATNTVGTPNSAFALYKYADAAKSWADMQPMWFFPNAGMGSATNGYRTAACGVEVDQTTALATIAVYTGENGYGVYEFQGVVATGLENTTLETVKAQKVLRDGQVIIIRNGVEYNVLGTQL